MLSAIVGLVVVAAITPGPNNVVVLQAAARAGLGAAAPAIGGILLGSVALLVLVHAGAGLAFAAEPRLRAVITLGGSLYVSWLGLRMMRSRASVASAAAAPHAAAHPAVRTVLAMLLFQFLNPKGWVMAATATAAAAAIPLGQLALVFTLVPALCLFVWALLGAALSRALERPTAAIWFDRAMGALLVASAIPLALEA